MNVSVWHHDQLITSEAMHLMAPASARVMIAYDASGAVPVT